MVDDFGLDVVGTEEGMRGDNGPPVIRGLLETDKLRAPLCEAPTIGDTGAGDPDRLRFGEGNI